MSEGREGVGFGHQLVAGFTNFGKQRESSWSTVVLANGLCRKLCVVAGGRPCKTLLIYCPICALFSQCATSFDYCILSIVTSRN